MTFLVAAIPLVALVAVLIVRFAVAEGRYSNAARLATGHEAATQAASSPASFFRAVNADLHARREIDAAVTSGAIDDSALAALYRERIVRLRQVLIGMGIAIVGIPVLTYLLQIWA